jgi:hypothetical protein
VQLLKISDVASQKLHAHPEHVTASVVMITDHHRRQLTTENQALIQEAGGRYV